MEEIVSGKGGANTTAGRETVTARYTYDVLQTYANVLTETVNGKTIAYEYGLERIAAYTGTSAEQIKTQYVYDVRGSVIETVTAKAQRELIDERNDFMKKTILISFICVLILFAMFMLLRSNLLSSNEGEWDLSDLEVVKNFFENDRYSETDRLVEWADSIVERGYMHYGKQLTINSERFTIHIDLYDDCGGTFRPYSKFGWFKANGKYCMQGSVSNGNCQIFIDMQTDNLAKDTLVSYIEEAIGLLYDTQIAH